MWEQLLQWDREALIFLNNQGAKEFDAFWSLITHIATWIPLFLLFILLFFRGAPKRKALLQVGWVVALAIFILLLTDLTKHLVARIRPNNDIAIQTMIRIVKNPSDYSFFSGHSASSFAITVLVVLLLRKKHPWTYAFFLWPLLFASSRIFVGVHFPSDILVGALVGTASAMLFYNIFKKRIAPKWLADPA